MPRTRYAVALVVLLSFAGLTLTASPVMAKGNTGGVVVTDYPVTTQFADPSGIVAGPDGALWFTDSGLTGSIGRVTTAGVVTTYTDPSINRPQQITVGSDGALWFTNFNSNTIGRITTTGVVASYTTPGLSLPYAITAGSDGALWFTYLGGIGRITTAGVITNLFPIAGINSLTNGLTTTADGSLWFVIGNNVEQMTSSGVVTNSYRVPALADSVAGITTGSDGALWVTARVNNIGLIARITTGGAITTYQIGHVVPTAITSGPDGALWVLAGSTKVRGDYSVVRLTTSGVVRATKVRGSPARSSLPLGRTGRSGSRTRTAMTSVPSAGLRFPHRRSRESVQLPRWLATGCTSRGLTYRTRHQ